MIINHKFSNRNNARSPNNLVYIILNVALVVNVTNVAGLTYQKTQTAIMTLVLSTDTPSKSKFRNSKLDTHSNDIYGCCYIIGEIREFIARL